ncbi:MAG: acyl-CoA dehydrogenase, partial [archaeon]|nr:acyl-CoA dehydrogenase [archaeon]
MSSHNTDKDCWIIIDDGVYDVTDFINSHPGGAKPLIGVAGKDATKEFQMFHDAQRVLHQVGAPFRIGTLVKGGATPSLSLSSSGSGSGSDSHPSDPSLGDGLPYLNREKSLLDKELQSATFHIPSMTNILDGGPERTEKRRWILKPLEQLALRGKSEMARVELLEAHFRDFIAIHKPFIENGYTP